MVRSRLPVPSLLGLFGALLMLFPELPMGSAEYIYDAKDAEGHKALASIVELYNQKRVDSANYFKVLQVLKAQYKRTHPIEYRFTVELVKTICRKRADWNMPYQRIQKCRQPAENQETSNCFFHVMPQPPPKEMKFVSKVCK